MSQMGARSQLLRNRYNLGGIDKRPARMADGGHPGFRAYIDLRGPRGGVEDGAAPVHGSVMRGAPGGGKTRLALTHAHAPLPCWWLPGATA